MAEPPQGYSPSSLLARVPGGAPGRLAALGVVGFVGITGVIALVRLLAAANEIKAVAGACCVPLSESALTSLLQGFGKY